MNNNRIETPTARYLKVSAYGGYQSGAFVANWVNQTTGVYYTISQINGETRIETNYNGRDAYKNFSLRFRAAMAENKAA